MDWQEQSLHICCSSIFDDLLFPKISTQESLVWSTVNEICQRGVRQALQERPLSKVTAVGMDEFAIKKGHRDYAAVIVDLEHIELIDILEYREQAKRIGYFKGTGLEWCEGIEVFCSDLWSGFIHTARSYFLRRPGSLIDCIFWLPPQSGGQSMEKLTPSI